MFCTDEACAGTKFCTDVAFAYADTRKGAHEGTGKGLKGRNDAQAVATGIGLRAPYAVPGTDVAHAHPATKLHTGLALYNSLYKAEY
eukprot:1906008-Rhodomonas_salina.2